MNTHTLGIGDALLPALKPLGVFAGKSIPSYSASNNNECATASLEYGRRSLVEWEEILILVVIVIAVLVVIAVDLFVIVVTGLSGRGGGVVEVDVIVWGTGVLAYIYVCVCV